ncbi:hypothetical protein BB559_006124 [Furculomyces boomerangus]|uniref:chitin synthase n=2 Tax=Harpellales TaxID=61421 RepID=A0A2T9Y4P7_9FUNG|nr:hypothetical protein BB559_006124 [Furculomyces boomerangus]PVZ99574.1 hypothetical protein BB558_004403 [Smittium angustum]
MNWQQQNPQGNPNQFSQPQMLHPSNSTNTINNFNQGYEPENNDKYIVDGGFDSFENNSDPNEKSKKPQDSKVVDNEEEIEETTTRAVWVNITWIFTFLIPGFVLKRCGMPREDVQFAWREKVALCMIILMIWAILLFMIIGLGLLLCPKQYVWSQDEIRNHMDEKDAYISLRGNVYDITYFMNQVHGLGMNGAPRDIMKMYAGYEVNASFPLAVRTACPGLIQQSDDPDSTMYLSTSEVPEESLNWYVHKVGSLANSAEMSDPNFYWNYVLPRMKSFKKGSLVWTADTVKNYHKDQGLYWRIIDGEVFNLGDYFYTSRSPQNIQLKKWSFLDPEIVAIFDDGGARSTDVSEYWKNMKMDAITKRNNYNCMKQLFYVGKVDTRRSTRCLFMNYMLFTFACALVAVVFIKFIASLQFGTKKKPLPSSKYVICQIPCYTEGEESISRTINSLAALEYSDKRRLIFIICDGNIVGSGNDKPTPRIVLDILGVDPDYDPPEREYLAVAEGSKQYNRAKVYSGLYYFEGNDVPFVVVVKVGNPFETSKPGNRGKRDSQILLMSFLHKVHLNLPMTPFELELYHHMEHIIGLPPRIFEFLLQVDADTLVAPDSLSRLVSTCASDSRIAGICGETRLANEQKSWITMMQVYEYFISHHMAKAFESIFGAVTCLPGCFCMYRILSSNGKMLLISKPVLDGYSERHVDTLHKKNLLSLGEDRYLTTLMLKHFPNNSLKFIRDAKCDTIAPEKWSVLVSQRRRWINSTVHNLFELVLINDLCGFCCFSMRFVVMLDLFGTLTIPTVLVYMCYLVFISITKVADVGYISLIIIGAVYGLQAVIFILRREWQHIGWMIIYLCCFPLWSFVLPIYSFWHFDDFSWGNTRTVIGEGKRKVVVENDFEFDPKSIVLMNWREYESHLAAMGQLNEPPPNMNPNVGQISMGVLPIAPSRAGTRVGTPLSFIGNPNASTPVPMGMNMYEANQMQMNNQYPVIDNSNGQIAYPMPAAYNMGGGVMNSMENIQVDHNGEMVHEMMQDPYLVNSGVPTEDQIVESIRRILATTDLNLISKKTVRDCLAVEFGIDMTPFKDFISEVVDLILKGE